MRGNRPEQERFFVSRHSQKGQCISLVIFRGSCQDFEGYDLAEKKNRDLIKCVEAQQRWKELYRICVKTSVGKSKFPRRFTESLIKAKEEMGSLSIT